MDGMKNEAEVKAFIRDEVRAEGGYGRRFEDKFTVGQPDLMLIPIRCPVIWAEVKVIKKRTWGATLRQDIELRELTRPPYCYGMLIGWRDGLLYACGPTTATTIEECEVQMVDEKVPDFLRRAMSHV
jgi:hypothetical protein